MPTIYLLDSNTISALTLRSPITQQKIRELQPGDEIVTCFVVVGEWEYGILNAPRRKQEEIRKQGELIFEAMPRIIESTPEISVAYGEIAAELRRAGTMIPQNDIWIAAVGRVVGATIITSDNHFLRVPNIFLADWTVP